MKESLKKNYPLFLSLFILLLLCALILPVNFTADPGDGIQHYYYARNLFSHPENFFNLWAKPLFTLLSSPFAQFGIKGMHFFNILCATLTFYLLIRTTQKLGFRVPVVAAFTFLVIPVYFPLVCSAMTEPFFALMLSLVVFLFSSRKFTAAALTLSFLPFARQEGYLLIPVMGITLLLMRQFRPLMYLITGPVIFSLLGKIFLDDFLWLLHDNPYTGAAAIYGHGTFMHFISGSEIIFGFPVQAGLCAALLLLLYRFLQKVFRGHAKMLISDNTFTTVFFLIAACFAGFFMAHTVMWWKGLNGSLGLFRVMACIAPLAALLAHYVISELYTRFPNKITSTWVPLIFVATGLVVLCTRSGFPPQKGEEILLTEKAGDFLNQKKIMAKTLYFSSPWLPFYLEKNPMSDSTVMELSSNPLFKKGDVIVWDSHFGPNENGFARTRLLNDSVFSVLTILKSEKGLKTLHQIPFEIIIAERK